MENSMKFVGASLAVLAFCTLLGVEMSNPGFILKSFAGENTETYTVYNVTIGTEDGKFLYEYNKDKHYYSYTMDTELATKFNLTFNNALQFSIYNTSIGQYMTLTSSGLGNNDKPNTLYDYNVYNKGISGYQGENQRFIAFRPGDSYNYFKDFAMSSKNDIVFIQGLPKDTCTGIDRSTYLSDRVWNLLVYSLPYIAQ